MAVTTQELEAFLRQHELGVFKKQVMCGREVLVNSVDLTVFPEEVLRRIMINAIIVADDVDHGHLDSTFFGSYRDDDTELGGGFEWVIASLYSYWFDDDNVVSCDIGQ